MPSQAINKILVHSDDLLKAAQSMPTVQAAPTNGQPAEAHALAQLTQTAQLAEYQSLVQYISSRRSIQMTLNVIAITGSAGILGVVLGQAKNIGGVAWLAALIPLPLVSVAWVSWNGVRKLDNTTWMHVEQIEADLGLDGHTWVYKHVNNNLWDKARNWSWDFLYLMFAIISVLTSSFLFSHP